MCPRASGNCGVGRTANPRLLTAAALVFSLLGHPAVPGCSGAQFTYLGCYADNSTSHDLSGPSISLLDPNVTADSCLAGCQTQGYAYGGLQGSVSKCYCGTSYGNYGLSSTGCNLVCNGRECGGTLSNSVYYTVDSSSATLTQQSLLFISTTQPYSAARMDCVTHNGDLAALNRIDLNRTTALIAQSGTGLTQVWIGMMKNTTTMQYDWVNPTVPTYNVSSPNSLDWMVQQVPSECVMFDSTSGQLESAPCNVPFAYLCMSIPWSAAVLYTPSTPTSGNSQMALYIILPIILLCYGGSCLIYCIHKGIKYCCRRDKPTLSAGPKGGVPAISLSAPSSIPRPAGGHDEFSPGGMRGGVGALNMAPPGRASLEEAPPPSFYGREIKQGLELKVTDEKEQMSAEVTSSRVNLLGKNRQESAA